MRFRTVLAALATLVALHSGAVAAQEIRVVLLGTGGPWPRLDRFGPSILVEAGSERLIFDVGRGALQRLSQDSIAFQSITGVFFTHLHSDHVVGLPDLWLTGWLLGHRSTPLELRGPPGTADMARHLTEAFEFDVRIRSANGRSKASGAVLTAEDIHEGIVLTRNGVRVTAFNVDHGRIKPALGYRVDYAGHSVVLSGDTRPSPNLIAHARGTDLLVYEVAAASPADVGDPGTGLRELIGLHSTPAEAAIVFAAVAPKLAVYSHILLFSGIPADSLVPLTRARYAGPLVVGADRMTFHVGSDVRVEAAPGR